MVGYKVSIGLKRISKERTLSAFEALLRNLLNDLRKTINIQTFGTEDIQNSKQECQVGCTILV
jgi:hypothetical protein